MTTDTEETAAATADRYVKAARATVEALREVAIGDFDQREQLQREIELALDAASVYSRLAVAEAIDRAAPAEIPVGLRFDGRGDDETGRKIREHLEAHARATGSGSRGVAL